MNARPNNNPPTPVSRSRNRKLRPQINVPADTLLTFASYHTPIESPRRTKPIASSSSRLHRLSYPQANFQFLLRQGADVAHVPLVHDADIPWSDIDLVVMPFNPDCAICLNDLKCPRVTSCGHVFDLVCFLQHVAVNGDQGAVKCPLCAKWVRVSELKMCTFLNASPVHVAGSVDMELKYRYKGCMVVGGRGATSGLPWVEDVDRMECRAGYARKKLLKRMLEMNKAELKLARKEREEGVEFIVMAEEELHRLNEDIESRDWEENEEVNDDDESSEHGSNEERWYFYQVADGQNMFLHPINHRCLVTEWETQGKKLERIQGTVVEIERATMCDRTRRKLRFLEHLPDGCEFALVELDLSHILSEGTLKTHGAELKERKLARRKKETRTRLEDRQIEQQQSQVLREYFYTQGGLTELRGELLQQSVDSNDVNSFPALSQGGGGGAGAGAGAEAGAPAQRLERNDGSSYSSVTSNMGLFPVLGDSQMAASYPPQPRGVWGARGAENVASGERRRRGKMTILSNAQTPRRR